MKVDAVEVHGAIKQSFLCPEQSKLQWKNFTLSVAQPLAPDKVAVHALVVVDQLCNLLRKSNKGETECPVYRLGGLWHLALIEYSVVFDQKQSVAWKEVTTKKYSAERRTYLLKHERVHLKLHQLAAGTGFDRVKKLTSRAANAIQAVNELFAAATKELTDARKKARYDNTAYEQKVKHGAVEKEQKAYNTLYLGDK